MTLQELNKFCEDNNIPSDTPIAIERGIDLVEDAVRAIHNGLELVLFTGGYDNEVIAS